MPIKFKLNSRGMPPISAEGQRQPSNQISGPVAMPYGRPIYTAIQFASLKPPAQPATSTVITYY